ncbi:DUF2971 domain-containing protein [Pseudomonas syringae]|uniref:DUF2971 domain-containing protein n=1 Tax=Pseudomonas syringae TaxID=317 RepID=UPI003F778294
MSGELDSLYMYFAGREQLNDPLEGYADIFFDGDEIAWNNLLKNYLQCLTMHIVRLAYGEGGKYDLSSQMLGIAQNIPDNISKIFEKIYAEFLAEPTISDFVSVWPALGKATKSELFSYLDGIHFYSIDLIARTLSDEGLLPMAPARNKEKYQYQLGRVRLFTNLFKVSDPDQKRVAMDEYVRANKERSLLNLYKNRKRDLPVLYTEMIAFPSKYCDSLEKCIFPTWYVACFMEECDDSSIWGTYGQNHAAVCLEFNVENNSEKRGLTLYKPTGAGSDGVHWSESFMAFSPVSYGETFASIDFFNSLGSTTYYNALNFWLSDGKGRLSTKAHDLTESEEAWRSAYWENFNLTATVKVSHWAREREYRLIQHSTIVDLSEPTLRKLKFKFSSLNGIIFGINTSLEDKCKLIAKIEQLCLDHKREHFNFYQARYDHKLKKITKDLLKSVKVGYDAPTPYE